MFTLRCRKCLSCPRRGAGKFPLQGVNNSTTWVTPQGWILGEAQHPTPWVGARKQQFSSWGEEPQGGQSSPFLMTWEQSEEPELGFVALLWLEESTAAACPCQDAACPLPTWFCNRWAQCMGNRLGHSWAITPKPWEQLCWGSCYELCGVTHLCTGRQHGGVNNP